MSIFGLMLTLNLLILILQVRSMTPLTNDLPYVGSVCSGNGTPKYSPGSIFEAKLNDILTDLPFLASETGFANVTRGQGIDEVNAHVFCREDMIKGQECQDCIKTAAQAIRQHCPFKKEGIIYYEHCTLRYANYIIVYNSGAEANQIFFYPNHTGELQTLQNYKQKFNNLMSNLIKQTARDEKQHGFGIDQIDLPADQLILQAIVQCSPYITNESCYDCLNRALAGGIDGYNTPMVFLPSCNLRYDLYPSQHNTTASSGFAIRHLVIILVPVIVVFVLASLSTFLLRRCYESCRRPKNNIGIAKKFSFLELAWATSCFSKRMILEGGGFGHVYKGTLLDDREVAIKRLNMGSSQGDEEFLTEITTISGVQHQNVISLYGYGVLFRERLLVYEYVPNQTLDYHLHNGKAELLSWERRMATAISLADVFAYLHDRNPAIIHRDIKPTNILIDSEFQPKVGDFGLAKLIYENRTHMTTIVRGTRGYLDPYYLMTEEIRRKSDVFAFGIVLLELLSGRRVVFAENNVVESIHIMDWAEPMIKEALSDYDPPPIERRKVDALVDPKSEKSYIYDELYRMVTCAAICMRTLPPERPTMKEVADVLRGDNEKLEEFKQNLKKLWDNETNPQSSIHGVGSSILSKSTSQTSDEPLDTKNSSSSSRRLAQNREGSVESFRAQSNKPHSF